MTALRKGGAHDSAPQGEVPMTALREVEEELSPNLGDKRTATDRRHRLWASPPPS